MSDNIRLELQLQRIRMQALQLRSETSRSEKSLAETAQSPTAADQTSDQLSPGAQPMNPAASPEHARRNSVTHRPSELQGLHVRNSVGPGLQGPCHNASEDSGSKVTPTANPSLPARFLIVPEDLRHPITAQERMQAIKEERSSAKNFEKWLSTGGVGRLESRNFGYLSVPEEYIVDDDGQSLPVWNDDVADVIGKTCGRNLEGSKCPLKYCPHLHICEQWAKDEKQCQETGLTHTSPDGKQVAHIRRSCKFHIAGGTCHRDALDCPRSHNYVHVRRDRVAIYIRNKAIVSQTPAAERPDLRLPAQVTTNPRDQDDV